MPGDFRRIYEVLLGGRVESVLIGGYAAHWHGSPRDTLDVDVADRRTRENMQRISPAPAG